MARFLWAMLDNGILIAVLLPARNPEIYFACSELSIFRSCGVWIGRGDVDRLFLPMRRFGLVKFIFISLVSGCLSVVIWSVMKIFEPPLPRFPRILVAAIGANLSIVKLLEICLFEARDGSWVFLLFDLISALASYPFLCWCKLTWEARYRVSMEP